MAYEPLKKVLYRDPSPERFTRVTELARTRLEDAGTFRTGIMLGDEELFLAFPRELALLCERILQRQRDVDTRWELLPHVAQGALVRSLVLDEVQSSNEIEQVHSTRHDIQLALEAAMGRSGGEHTPYVELARLYLGLTQPRTSWPTTLEDIRAIYDSATHGTISSGDEPDGRLFRKGPVHITNGLRSVHDGVMPEARVEAMLRQVLALMDSGDIPQLCAAALSHLAFEHVHPFYDGNGRTGRYLLALCLTRALSLPVALTLSRTIAESKGRYYKAFTAAEDPMNHAEGTFFVLELLGFVERAQESLADQLAESSVRIREVEQAIRDSAKFEGLSEKARETLFVVAQLDLFASDGRTWPQDVERHLACTRQTARRYLGALEGHGLAARLSTRPVTFGLSERGRRELGLV